jgi:putative SOS response-associated peptidase YedK
LILADGFYEWRQIPGSTTKQPIFIKLKDGSPFAFAGLWEVWMSPEGDELRTCTIITTQPNSLVEPIHNRMPAILSPIDYTSWLARDEQPVDKLNRLLKPYPASDMVATPVSKLVNKPDVDTPEVIKPAEKIY